MPATTVATLPEQEELKKPILEEVKPSAEPAKVAAGIKAIEADEPILQENPHRFVLFPIKYHEVCLSNASRVKWIFQTDSY